MIILVALLGVFVLLAGGLIAIATEMRDRSLHPGSSVLPAKPTVIAEEIIELRRTRRVTRG